MVRKGLQGFVPQAAVDRLQALISPEPNSGCWLWTGGVSNVGYGKFSLDGRTVPAHRAAWALLVGEIAAGLDIDHRCRNRCCVNPAHLEPVTRRENLLRSKGTWASLSLRTHCKNGHPFTPENTAARSDGHGRRCLACEGRRATKRVM